LIEAPVSVRPGRSKDQRTFGWRSTVDPPGSSEEGVARWEATPELVSQDRERVGKAKASINQVTNTGRSYARRSGGWQQCRPPFLFSDANSVRSPQRTYAAGGSYDSIWATQSSHFVPGSLGRRVPRLVAIGSAAPDRLQTAVSIWCIGTSLTSSSAGTEPVRGSWTGAASARITASREEPRGRSPPTRIRIHQCALGRAGGVGDRADGAWGTIGV
jgi:hypothetical protein